MSMEDIDDIFKDDGLFEEPQNVEVTPDNEPAQEDNFFKLEKPTDTEGEQSIVRDLLKEMGIEDGKITIVDENNESQDIDFFSLSREEQLDILGSSVGEDEDDNDYGLADHEIELVNYLRENNISLNDLLEKHRQEIIEELSEQQGQSYDIDAYDDQELFLFDLKNKYDLSDEQLVKELEKELQDEELFNKKVGVLRKEYKDLEDQYREAKEVEFEAQQEAQYNQFSETMVDVALNKDEFYGIELEDEEKEEVLSFLLDLDDEGMTPFKRMLQDPAKLYEAAWFLRYGKESFDAIKNAYESEISRLSRVDQKPAVVKRTGTSKEKSIFDLDNF